jgi:membrane dipeptidase
MIEALITQVARHAGRLTLATSVQDIREAAAGGRVAALMGLEGGHAIENELRNVENFYDLGCRYMTLTWSNTNDWADSSGDAPRHGGLTDFGRQVVSEMNRLGMLVDVSHVSDDTFWDVIEVASAPVIASHSSARALVDVPRNMSDEMLRAVGSNGGVVMVNFGGMFIDPRKAGYGKTALDVLRHLGPSPVPLARLLDQIEHVARTAGIDHVGLGSDFDGTLFMPEGVRDVSGFPNITAGLLERGWSEEEIHKILGENLLRVFARAEEVARR